ncbi:MAG: carboxypeptidase-like regulatory domain-containing protein [Paludibacter sp.]|nr:carboxypeptidase-like regulatory domain-containing protein [Paludibacter sp.]
MKTNQLVRVFLLAGLVLLGTQAFAAGSFEIKGKIVKSSIEAENQAKVFLLDSKSMELVDQITCNKQGEFTFEEVEKGEYLLMVVKPGYKKADTRYIKIDEKGTVSNNPSDLPPKSYAKIEMAPIDDLN